MAIRKGDRKLMRAMNNTHVLQVIRSKGPISRIEIAEHTKLGLSTISNIVNDLLNSRLVLEVGEGDSSGGRKPNLLNLNYSARYVFGVKIGQGEIWVGLCNLRGELLEIAAFTFSVDQNPIDVIDTIGSVVLSQIKKRRLKKSDVMGIGLCVSGLVSPETGACIYSPILDWKNVQLKKELEHRTRLWVMIENDVNALAFGMVQLEAFRGSQNLVCVTTGVGVGAGIIIDGKVYRGKNGNAGELGHMSLDLNGPPCACGRRGCMDVLASDQYLVNQAIKAIEKGESTLLEPIFRAGKLSRDTILSTAQKGDEIALRIYREMAVNLANGIANLVNILNPDKIVISGEGAVAGPLLLHTVQSVVKEISFPGLSDHLEIVLDDGMEDKWLQGASFLIIERFFEMQLNDEETVSLI